MSSRIEGNQSSQGEDKGTSSRARWSREPREGEDQVEKERCIRWREGKGKGMG